MFPWSPNWSQASPRPVYFQDLGMTRAWNFCPKFVTCLYSRPLTWVKTSVSCCSAFPLDEHLEICLQKESVFCIWRRASNLSTVSDLGVGFGTGETSGVILGCAVDISGIRHCQVWLLVLKADPSVFETENMLIGTDVVWGGSPRHER